MVNDKMVNVMKKYIQPATNSHVICYTNSICVGSIHGNAPLQYGGGATNGSGYRPQ